MITVYDRWKIFFDNIFFFVSTANYLEMTCNVTQERAIDSAVNPRDNLYTLCYFLSCLISPFSLFEQKSNGQGCTVQHCIIITFLSRSGHFV